VEYVLGCPSNPIASIILSSREPQSLCSRVLKSLDDCDGLGWEAENLDPVDGIVFRPSWRNGRQNDLEDGCLV